MSWLSAAWSSTNPATGRSIVPLVSLTITGFVLVIIFIIYNYTRFLQDMEAVQIKQELESRKMLINSELMEMARSRTRMTSRIIDIEDPFEQDRLNLELENLAGRFASLREQLLELPLTEAEKTLLAKNDAIVPVILPAQRAVVEMAMNQNREDDSTAKQTLYDVVLPGQGELIRNLGFLISLEQHRIAELTGQSLVAFAVMKEDNYKILSAILLVTVVLSMVIVWRIRRIQYALSASSQRLEQANLTLEHKVMERTEALNRLNEKLREASEHDELTGLYNRRRYNTYIDYEYARTRREGGCFSLIMADIDYFKAYNDCYGHQQGDQCIQAVAQAIRNCLPRSIDFAARYGGEEFVIVLPNTDSDGAKTVAGHIRQAVCDLVMPHAGSAVASYVTVSLGVATYSARDDATINDIVEQADKNLYQAKTSGRNQIVVSGGA